MGLFIENPTRAILSPQVHMRILLVLPPMLGEERYGKLAGAGSYLPPLGLLYLAGVLKDRYDVKVIDGSVLDVTMQDMADLIGSWKPRVLGVSAITPTFYRAVELCRVAKQINQGIVTVIGGPHPSACPEETMSHEGVDFVVRGEGEVTFGELLDRIEKSEDVSSVAGICHKTAEGKISSTPPRERITELDSMPFPARELIDTEAYKPSVMHYKHLPAFSIVCGRGCPFRCTFCSCSKVFRGKVTLRSVENVISEIRDLVSRYSASEIMVWDDTFGISKKWVTEFCRQIRPLQISWSAWMRVDMVDKDMLARMADSGCWHISYGVESGNQKVLDTIKKGFTLDDVRNAFKLTHEAGMEARGTFILGLPNETWQSMMDTINLAIAIEADYAQFQLLTPYPGTELWDTIEQYGEFSTKDLSKYTIWFPVFVPKGLSKADLERAHKLAYRMFYFRPGYILKRIAHVRTFDDIRRNLIGLNSLFTYFKRSRRG